MAGVENPLSADQVEPRPDVRLIILTLRSAREAQTDLYILIF